MIQLFIGNNESIEIYMLQGLNVVVSRTKLCSNTKKGQQKLLLLSIKALKNLNV
jgi:hypothetical protein